MGRSIYRIIADDGLVFSNYRSLPIGSSDGRYLSIKAAGKKVYIHRMIWEYVNGRIPNDMVIDHIDGDKLNNKISNLRMCKQSENTQNRKLGKCFNIDSGRIKKYRAQIKINGKVLTKNFYSSDEAIAFYKIKKRELHTHYNGERQ